MYLESGNNKYILSLYIGFFSSSFLPSNSIVMGFLRILKTIENKKGIAVCLLSQGSTSNLIAPHNPSVMTRWILFFFTYTTDWSNFYIKSNKLQKY